MLFVKKTLRSRFFFRWEKSKDQYKYAKRGCDLHSILYKSSGKQWFFHIAFDISRCFSSKNHNAYFFFFRLKIQKIFLLEYFFFEGFFPNLAVINLILTAFLHLIPVAASHDATINNSGNTFMTTIALTVSIWREWTWAHINDLS